MSQTQKDTETTKKNPEEPVAELKNVEKRVSDEKTEADDAVLESATKRQKISQEESKDVKVPEGKDDGADSEDFNGEAGEADDDSFDDDFDAEESEPHGEDDDFDLEKYLKWRKEHPGEEEPKKGDLAKGDVEDEEDEEDDYDDEDEEEDEEK